MKSVENPAPDVAAGDRYCREYRNDAGILRRRDREPEQRIDDHAERVGDRHAGGDVGDRFDDGLGSRLHV